MNTSHNISVSLTDNYGWVTCSVTSSLDHFFRAFIVRNGYEKKTSLIRKVTVNNEVISRVYRIGGVSNGVDFKSVKEKFLRFLEGAVYA